MAPRPGFEPGSQPRQGCMIGHYTIRAGDGTTTVLYFNRSREGGAFLPSILAQITKSIETNSGHHSSSLFGPTSI